MLYLSKIMKICIFFSFSILKIDVDKVRRGIGHNSERRLLSVQRVTVKTTGFAMSPTKFRHKYPNSLHQFIKCVAKQ